MNITIDVNLNAPGLVTVLQNLVGILGAAPIAVNGQVPKANNTAAEVKQKEEKEVEEPEAKQVAVEDDNQPDQQDEQDEQEEENATSLTIVDIRKLVSKAAKKDRTAVKELLKEFGADNASALDKKHYEEFSVKVKELI